MEESPEDPIDLAGVKEEPPHLANFEIDAEMESMLENLEDLIFEFEPHEGDDDENDDNGSDDDDDDDDCIMIENENSEQGPENSDQEEEAEENDDENEVEEEPDTVKDKNEEEENVINRNEKEEADSTVVNEDEVKQMEDGELNGDETAFIGSETSEIEDTEKEGSERIYGNQKIQSTGDSKVEMDEENKCISEDSIIVESKLKKMANCYVLLDRTAIVEPSSTCTDEETSSSEIDKEISTNQVNNKEQSLPNEKTHSDEESSSKIDKEISTNQVNKEEERLSNEKTDQNSQTSTKVSTNCTKRERKPSFQNELQKMMDECYSQEEAGTSNNTSGAEVKVNKTVDLDSSKSDFGVQTTLELPLLTREEMNSDLSNVSDADFDKNFESGECTSSDDEEEAVNALRDDKMFNLKIDTMMNSFGEMDMKKDSTVPTVENDKEKLYKSKKKEQIIKLLYRKIKSVGENRIVDEMISKKLVDEQSKEKLLEIIRYCVEKRKEKKRMKRLRKKAHFLKVTKNNAYLDSLEKKTQVVFTHHSTKSSKPANHKSIIVDSKITKRVIVDCNAVNLKSETIDKDLKRLIMKKQLAKHLDSSSLKLRKEKHPSIASVVTCSSLRERDHKKYSRCRKKGCERNKCKKHITKEEKKRKRAERDRRKIEILLKRREKLRIQYQEALRKKSETVISSTSSHDSADPEKKKKIELQNRINEKIQLVFCNRDSKQTAAGEVSCSEARLDRSEKFELCKEGGYISDGSKSHGKKIQNCRDGSHSSDPTQIDLKDLVERLQNIRKDSYSSRTTEIGLKDINEEFQNSKDGSFSSDTTQIGLKDRFETFQKSRDVDSNSDGSKKSMVNSSHPSKPIVKGPAAEWFSELYQTLEKKSSTSNSTSELYQTLVNKDIVKEVITGSDKVENDLDDNGELFPTISSIICEDMELDSDCQVPSPPPPPIISDEADLASNRVDPKEADSPASPSPPPSSVSSGSSKQRAPPRRSRSLVRNQARAEDKDRRKMKSRSRSRSPKHRKNRSPVSKKAETIAARRRRSPSLTGNDWYGRKRVWPAESASKQARTRDPTHAMWKRRSRSRSRSRERDKRPLPSSRTSKSPPRTSRMSEFRQKKKEDFEEAIRQWRKAQENAQKKPHMTPAHMMSPYHTSVPDTSMGHYGHPPAMTYASPDMLQTPQASSSNTTGVVHQVGIISTVDHGPNLISQSSGETTTTINENVPDSLQMLPSGMGQAAAALCHHQTSVPDTHAQPPVFNNRAEGFPHFNPQTNTGFSMNMPCAFDEACANSEPSDNDNCSMPGGFPMFSPQPPPGHLPYKVVHHPQFPYPIPVPYIEPPQTMLHQGPIIPFICPPPPPPPHPQPPTNPLLNTPPPLPLTEPPPLINPPLPPSPAPSTICSSPVRPSSPAVSECGSVKSTTSNRKKIGHDLKNMIDLIKGKFDHAEPPTETNEPPPCSTPRRNKSFNVKDLKELISTVRKNIAQKKSHSETSDKMSEKVLSTENQDKPPSTSSGKLSEKVASTENQDKPRSIFRIEFKKPIVKNLVNREIAPEFLKALQEEEDDEGTVTAFETSNSTTKETSDNSNKSDKGLAADTKDNRMESDKDCLSSDSSRSDAEMLKSKPIDKEALIQKKMKMLEILSSLRTKISQDQQSATADAKANVDEEEPQTKSGEYVIETHSSKFIPSSCRTKSRNELKYVSRRTSSDSKSDGGARDIHVHERKQKPLQKRIPDLINTVPEFFIASKNTPEKMSPKTVVSESERSSIDSVPEFFIASGNRSVESSPAKSTETSSITCNKNSVDQKSKNERTARGGNISIENDRESQTKSELENPSPSSSKRRSRFSDAGPTVNVDSTKESHDRQEKNSISESNLTVKTIIKNVQQIQLPLLPSDVTENKMVTKSGSFEKAAILEIPASDGCKDVQSRAIMKDQQIDVGKSASPPNKISREEVLKQLKIELAQAKAACKASSGDILKNSSIKNNQKSTHEKLYGTKDLQSASKSVETVSVSKVESTNSSNSVLKNEGNLETPKSVEPISSSNNSTADITTSTKTDSLMNKEAQDSQKIMSTQNIVDNNSTTAPKARISLSDPRLNRQQNVEISKNVVLPATPLLDPRLHRTHSTEVSKNAGIMHLSISESRLNKAHNVEVTKNVDVSKASLDPRINRTPNEAIKNIELSQTAVFDSRLNNTEGNKKVEIIQTPSSDHRLNRVDNVGVDRNLEMLQNTQQNSENQPQNTLSEIPPKKATSKRLNSLILRVMNEFDPVILRESRLSADEDIPNDEQWESGEQAGEQAQLNKEVHSQDQSNQVRENVNPMNDDLSRPTKERLEKTSNKEIPHLASNKASVNIDSEKKEQHFPVNKNSTNNEQAPSKNKDSGKNEQSPSVNKDSTISGQAPSSNKYSTKSQSPAANKIGLNSTDDIYIPSPKLRIAHTAKTTANSQNKCESKFSGSLSTKKTEGVTSVSSEKVVADSKDKNVSKAHNKVDTKSPRVENLKLQKDKKTDQSDMSDAEHSKVVTIRLSSHEPVTSTGVQKKTCPSSDAMGKQRRSSVELLSEKQKKKAETKNSDFETSKDSALKSSSISLENSSVTPSNTKSINLKNPATIATKKREEGKLLKLSKCQDKTPVRLPSKKFVVSNLSNKEVTNMDPPPKVQERRSSVIEISSSDDESLKISTPAAKRNSDCSRDAIKKPAECKKYKRSNVDALSPSSQVESTNTNRDPFSRKKESPCITVAKQVKLIEKKQLSEVNELKRLLESDSSDDEIDFEKKRRKSVNKTSQTNATTKGETEKVIGTNSTKKVVLSGNRKEIVTTNEIEREKGNSRKIENEKAIEIDPINISESEKCIEKVTDYDESQENFPSKKTMEIEKSKEIHKVEEIGNKQVLESENSKEIEGNICIRKTAERGNSQGNVSIKYNETEESKENVTAKGMECSSSKDIVTTEKVLIDNSTDKESDRFDKIKTFKDNECGKNVEETKSLTTAANLNYQKSLEDVEVCQGDRKMKELTLSNEDFNFDIDSKHTKGAPNRKTKKLGKAGKLKNKFLKVGDDLFPDQESNESSDSFKNLITNICGTLEENDNPAVVEFGIKNADDASLIVAESLKILGSFVKVEKTIYRERKRIIVNNVVVDDQVLLIQPITDIKKMKNQKGKSANKGLYQQKRDGDSNSIVSSDSFDVFEFSEDLPTPVNERCSLVPPSTDSNRCSKPLLNVLDAGNENTKKDFSAQCSSIDVVDISALERGAVINFELKSSCTENVSTNCTTQVLSQKDDIIKLPGKEIVSRDGAFKIKSCDELVGKTFVNEISQIPYEIETLDAKKIRKNIPNNSLVQETEKIINSDTISAQNFDKIENASKKIDFSEGVSTKCFDLTVPQNVDEIESSSIELVSKKIEDSTDLITDNEISVQTINKIEGYSGKIVSTTSGTFIVNSGLTAQQVNEQHNTKFVPRKTSKSVFQNLQARYKANSNAFTTSTTTDKPIKKLRKRKSSQVLSPNDDETKVSNVVKETEDINTRVTRARKSAGTTSFEEVADKAPNVVENDVKANEDLNTRVTRARKSTGTAVLEEDVIEDEAKETGDMNTRVTRARKSLRSVVYSEENVIEDDAEETEDANSKVKRARKSIGTVKRLEAVEEKSTNEDVMENMGGNSTHEANSCERKSIGENESEKQVGDGKNKKNLRSKGKEKMNKEEANDESTPNEDELLWNRICQGLKSSRSVGTNVSKVKGKLLGFESFESVEESKMEADLDKVIASLMRLKNRRESQTP